MRLFIAVNFNEETRAGLLTMRDELRSRSERGNFSATENLHLTLAFLGECNVRQTAAIKAVMDAVRFEPFNAIINQIGQFSGVPAKLDSRGGKSDGGDIWWAGVQASTALIDMQRDLTDKLITAGLKVDKRRFNPHITLGREVVTDAVPWRIEPFGETVNSIELMKAERIGGKIMYKAIYERRA